MHVFFSETPYGLHGWHARQEACPHAVHRWVLWQQGLHRCPENYINPERNLTQAEQNREVSQKKHTITPVLVPFSHLWLALTLPIHTFRVKKEKQEKKQITFLYISIFVVLPCIQHLISYKCWPSRLGEP